MKIKYFSPKGLRETKNFFLWRPICKDDEDVFWWCDSKGKWWKDSDYEKIEDFPIGDGKHCKTLKAFKRQVKKSNLPKGTKCILRHNLFRHGYKGKSVSLDVIVTKE